MSNYVIEDVWAPHTDGHGHGFVVRVELTPHGSCRAVRTWACSCGAVWLNGEWLETD